MNGFISLLSIILSSAERWFLLKWAYFVINISIPGMSMRHQYCPFPQPSPQSDTECQLCNFVYSERKIALRNIIDTLFIRPCSPLELANVLPRTMNNHKRWSALFISFGSCERKITRREKLHWVFSVSVCCTSTGFPAILQSKSAISLYRAQFRLIKINKLSLSWFLGAAADGRPFNMFS